MSLTGFVSTNSIEINRHQAHYSPNVPLNLGLAFAIKNTVVNFRLNAGIMPLRSSKFGNTRSTNFQIHRYGRNWLFDASYQKYRGFYNGMKNVLLYPDLSVKQIGVEGCYVFNPRQFSAKAAFAQQEIQLKSAGSPLLGGDAYYYRLHLGDEILTADSNRINNLQLGVNAGYAYSWVLGSHWLLSAMATAGLNAGNEPSLLGKGQIKLYPSALGRASAGYHRDDWAVFFLSLVHNKSLYFFQRQKLSLTSVNMEIAYVKHFNRFFKKHG